MRVVIINKSDSTGGAAVVSYRLMEALRGAGVDARMLVAEKLKDSEYVEYIAPSWRLKETFIAERLRIFLNNGFDRKNLFKVDIASDGIDIASHPLVKSSDAILLNWVNQGILSFKGLHQLVETGKPVIWTMHDMWCFTGICHHSGDCHAYERHCHNCRFLGKGSRSHDLSWKVFNKKSELFPSSGIRFVAVSNWLKEKAATSPLFRNSKVNVIPNPFPLPINPVSRGEKSSELSGKRIILFGAARIDDPIKDFHTFIKSLQFLKEDYPELGNSVEIVTFGSIKNPELFQEIVYPHRHCGIITNSEEIRKIYEQSDVVVSTSLYETLPGTLVEGQAFGAIPVSFDRGGQRDIIEHKSTGYIAAWESDSDLRAKNIADGIFWGLTQSGDIHKKMYESVNKNFSYQSVAGQYIRLIEEIKSLK